MELALNIAQIVLSLALILAILLQQQGAGLGAGFGGDSAVYHTKRGAEKVLFHATVIVAILFFGLALVRVFVA